MQIANKIAPLHISNVTSHDAYQFMTRKIVPHIKPQQQNRNQKKPIFFLFSFSMPPLRHTKKSKQCRSAISDDIKRQICEWEEENQNKKHIEIANHFNEKYDLKIDRSTVSKILGQRDKWKSVIDTEFSGKTFRHRTVKYPLFDRAMNLWVENVTAGGVILTDMLIKEKAKSFANAFNIPENELAFSNGWLDRFKKRNNIRRYHAHGESGSAPLASLPEERAKLRQLLSRFPPEHIYNIDETGLYFRMAPNQTLSTKPVLGQKKDKTRITVLLGVNATGTDKLRPWVIGNAKRPRPLLHVNLERLPVHYRGNPKVWMNSTVFEEVLRDMDNYFRVHDKKILLLIDNAPSHFDPHYRLPEQDENNEEVNSTPASSERGRSNAGRSRPAHGILINKKSLIIYHY